MWRILQITESNIMTTEFKMPEPMGSYKKEFKAYVGYIPTVMYPSDFVKDSCYEGIYASSDMRAVIEQCALLAACAGSGSAEVAGLDVQDYIAEEIRKLLEQVK
jgi:hypothetical protein